MLGCHASLIERDERTLIYFSISIYEEQVLYGSVYRSFSLVLLLLTYGHRRIAYVDHLQAVEP